MATCPIRAATSAVLICSRSRRLLPIGSRNDLLPALAHRGDTNRHRPRIRLRLLERSQRPSLQIGRPMAIQRPPRFPLASEPIGLPRSIFQTDPLPTGSPIQCGRLGKWKRTRVQLAVLPIAISSARASIDWRLNPGCTRVKVIFAVAPSFGTFNVEGLNSRRPEELVSNRTANWHVGSHSSAIAPSPCHVLLSCTTSNSPL